MSTMPPLYSNDLLAYLPESEFIRLSPALTQVPMEVDQVLCAAGAKFEHVYFPERGAASAINIMENGTAIEVATIGPEGMVGLPLVFGTDSTPWKIFVQVPGSALRMKVKDFEREAGREGPFRQMLMSYNLAFLAQVSQLAACNGLHKIEKRCSRWILETQDRYRADEMPLTHEFLALMLGVRRSSVTDVLKPLQARGLIRCHRGMIKVLSRAELEDAACECYETVLKEYARVFGPRRQGPYLG